VPDPIILPTTFNDEFIVVALFNVVFPETLKLDLTVVWPDNIIVPPAGWRSKTWFYPVNCFNVCICELPNALGGTNANWYWLVYE